MKVEDTKNNKDNKNEITDKQLEKINGGVEDNSTKNNLTFNPSGNPGEIDSDDPAIH